MKFGSENSPLNALVYPSLFDDDFSPTVSDDVMILWRHVARYRFPPPFSPPPHDPPILFFRRGVFPRGGSLFCQRANDPENVAFMTWAKAGVVRFTIYIYIHMYVHTYGYNIRSASRLVSDRIGPFVQIKFLTLENLCSIFFFFQWCWNVTISFGVFNYFL